MLSVHTLFTKAVQVMEIAFLFLSTLFLTISLCVLLKDILKRAERELGAQNIGANKSNDRPDG